MSVVVSIDDPNGSRETYGRVISGMTLPVGGTTHPAGPGSCGGLRVVEVLDSEDDARRFPRDRFAPVLRAAQAPGPPCEPQLWPGHLSTTAVTT